MTSLPAPNPRLMVPAAVTGTSGTGRWLAAID